MMKNAFYFSTYFRFQVIQIFVLTFWSCSKNRSIRKKRLISEFMTSQPGLQAIAIHILPSISRTN